MQIISLIIKNESPGHGPFSHLLTLVVCLQGLPPPVAIWIMFLVFTLLPTPHVTLHFVHALHLDSLQSLPLRFEPPDQTNTEFWETCLHINYSSLSSKTLTPLGAFCNLCQAILIAFELLAIVRSNSFEVIYRKIKDAFRLFYAKILFLWSCGRWFESVLSLTFT